MTTTQKLPSLRTQNHDPQITPELTVLRPDGSWQSIPACAATPEQLNAEALPSNTIMGFIARARQADLGLDRVIATIRRNWES